MLYVPYTSVLKSYQKLANGYIPILKVVNWGASGLDPGNHNALWQTLQAKTCILEASTLCKVDVAQSTCHENHGKIHLLFWFNNPKVNFIKMSAYVNGGPHSLPAHTLLHEKSHSNTLFCPKIA